DGEECCCGHDHDHEHEHHHHHEDGEECCCGHDHDHEHEHHHHHHHADEVFASIGMETIRKFTKDEIHEKLNALADENRFGMVLRAKGMVASSEGGDWIHFDYVPEEMDVRTGCADVTGKIVVIGAGVKEDAVKELFLK
ncbi:MAG: GTP-binding protein, partial [Lachnospiraceae bacterium]